MKRFAVFCLALVFFLMTGCGVQPAPEETLPAYAEPSAEATVPTTEAAATEPQPEESGAEYEIIRRDQSYYNESGELIVEYYYDQILLLDNTPAHHQINRAIKAQADTVLTELPPEELQSMEEMYAEGYNFLYTCTAEVTHNNGDVFSFIIAVDWFMGGVYNRNYLGYTYDLNTGETADLPELFGLSAQVLTEELQNRAWNYLHENYADDLWEDAEATIFSFGLDDFRYFIQDGQLVLTFETYLLAPGAAGSFNVPTGLYLNQS